MLTYETIQQMVKTEKEKNALTRLPKDFFHQARAYLDKKHKMRSKEDMWEYDAAKSKLQDLIEIRERKILHMALNVTRAGIDPVNLSSEEEEFFNSVLKHVKEWQETKKTMLEAKPESKKLIALAGHIPKFVGINLKNYGPFNPGDIATVPEKNAKLLLKKDMAEPIKSKTI